VFTKIYIIKKLFIFNTVTILRILILIAVLKVLSNVVQNINRA